MHRLAIGSANPNVPTGMKPAEGFDPTSGHWVPEDPTGKTPTGDIVYTYAFDPIVAPANHTVTYKVLNGTWADGTSGIKTETVANGSAPTPSVGMLPNAGFGDGAWSPALSATVTGDVEYTYVFNAQPPVAPTAEPPAVANPFTITPVNYKVDENNRSTLVNLGVRPNAPSIVITGFAVQSVNGTPSTEVPNTKGNYTITLQVSYTENGTPKQALVTVPVTVYDNVTPQPTPTPKINAPKTGDSVNLTLYALLLVFALGTSTVTMKRKREN